MYDKLQLLLESEDPATVEQAIELVRSLGSEAYADLLRHVAFDPVGRLVPTGIFAESAERPLLQYGLLVLWLEGARDQTTLSRLDLSRSSLSRLPELEALCSLRELFLSHNPLRELPASLGKLQNLEYLDLSYNQLRELPASLGKLERLVRLDLRNNQLRALPPLEGLRSLRELDLSGNRLGALPSELAQLPRLEFLSLDRTELQELPAALAHSGLRSLSLLGTSLRDPLPVLERLPNLCALRLPARTEPVLRLPLERAHPRAVVCFR